MQPSRRAIMVNGVAALALSRGARAAAPAPRIIRLDTHLDTPMNFELQGWDILKTHDRGQVGSQVDLPRLIEGGLDDGFWAIYTPQGPRTPEGRKAARDAAFVRLAAIRELEAAHPGHLEVADDEVVRAALELAQRGGAVLDRADDVALHREEVREDLSDHLLVVDDEDAR